MPVDAPIFGTGSTASLGPSSHNHTYRNCLCWYSSSMLQPHLQCSNTTIGRTAHACHLPSRTHIPTVVRAPCLQQMQLVREILLSVGRDSSSFRGLSPALSHWFHLSSKNVKLVVKRQTVLLPVDWQDVFLDYELRLSAILSI